MLKCMKFDLKMLTTHTVNCMFYSKHSFLSSPSVSINNVMPLIMFSQSPFLFKLN